MTDGLKNFFFELEHKEANFFSDVVGWLLIFMTGASTGAVVFVGTSYIAPIFFFVATILWESAHKGAVDKWDKRADE